MCEHSLHALYRFSITQFLVFEPFFYHQAKKVASRKAKLFCMLFIFDVKPRCTFDQEIVKMNCFLRNRSLEFREI